MSATIRASPTNCASNIWGESMNKRIKDALRAQKMKWWALFIVVIGALDYMIYRSTDHAFPDLLELTVGMMVLTGAFTSFTHANANEPDPLVRRFGLAGFLAVALLDVATLWGHVSLSRDLSAAKAGQVEKRENESWAERLKTSATEREVKRLAAESETYKSRAELEKAQTRKLQTLPPTLRSQLATTLMRSQKGQGSTTAKDDPPPALLDPHIKQEGEATVYKTETQVKAEWRGFISKSTLFTVLIAVLFAAGMVAIKHWDSNSNNIPDYVERIYERNPELCRELYPEWYAILTNPGQLGNATA